MRQLTRDEPPIADAGGKREWLETARLDKQPYRPNGQDQPHRDQGGPKPAMLCIERDHRLALALLARPSRARALAQPQAHDRRGSVSQSRDPESAAPGRATTG